MSKPEKEDPDGLSLRERLWVNEYISNGGSSSQAAAAALGASEVSKYEIGRRMRMRPKVARAVETAMQKAAVGPAEVVRRLSEIAEGCPELYEVEGAGAGGYIRLNFQAMKKAGKLGLIKEIKYVDGLPEIKLYSRLEALALLGKVHALFTERVQIDQTVTVQTEQARAVMRSAFQSPELLARLVELGEGLRVAALPMAAAGRGPAAPVEVTATVVEGPVEGPER